jgi:hypothetical protein
MSADSEGMGNVSRATPPGPRSRREDMNVVTAHVSAVLAAFTQDMADPRLWSLADI